MTEGFHRLVRALGVNGPPPRGEILLPVGSARLRINLSEAEGGRPGKLLLECAVAREANQQDQALRACMLRNMSTALTRWVYLNQRQTIVLPRGGTGAFPSRSDVVGSPGGNRRNLDGSRGGHGRCCSGPGRGWVVIDPL